MRSLVPWLLVLAVLPRVEDPWPDTIGLELPFATATAGGVLAGVVCFLAGREKQERAVKLGGVLGFCAGAIVYCVTLLIQITSNS